MMGSDRLLARYRPSGLVATLENPRLGIAVLTLSVLGAALNAASLVLLYAVFGERAMVAMNLAVALLYAVGYLVFVVTGQVRAALLVVVWTSVVSNIVGHVLMGGFFYSGGYLLWGVVVTVITALWLDRVMTAAVASTYAVAAVVLATLEGTLQASRPQPSLALSMIVITDVFVFTLLLTAPSIVALLSQLRSEQARTEALMLNILPAPIAARLKSEPGVIADTIPDCSIVFADLVGFTAYARLVPADRVVRELNTIFSRFDEVVGAHGAEKIKTIGDGYMAACGVPEPRAGHVEAACALALDLLHSMDALNERLGTDFRLRVGLHSGSTVAGVIGTSKFAYDVWGDTVNLASRLESHGSPGVIAVSTAVAERARASFRFDTLGVVDLKGQGPTLVYRLLGPVAASP